MKPCQGCGKPIPSTRRWCAPCKALIVRERDRERKKGQYQPKTPEPMPTPNAGLLWQRGPVAIIRVDLS